MMREPADPLGREDRRRGRERLRAWMERDAEVRSTPKGRARESSAGEEAASAKRPDGSIKPGAGGTHAAAFPGFPGVVRKHIPRETTGPDAAPWARGRGGWGWLTLGPPRASPGRRPGQPPLRRY